MKRRRNISKSINTENLNDNIFTTLTNGNSVISEEDRQKIITKLEANMDMQFSEEQKQVIRHYDKPLNVIACAGAGKSTVLINKMFYTEMLYSVKPSSMLAITFNADASQELSKRYNKIKKSLGIRHKVHPTFKTFHSLFYMLLKTLPRYKKSEIVSESKYTFELLKLIISDGTKDNKETFSDIMKYRGTVINKSISPDGLENVTFDSVTFRPHIYTKVVERYEELKALDNAMDFDDMMVILQRELKGIDGDKLRENFRSIFTHVYIDEFQDSATRF